MIKSTMKFCTKNLEKLVINKEQMLEGHFENKNRQNQPSIHTNQAKIIELEN